MQSDGSKLVLSNLSYVLHERSSSPVVKETARLLMDDQKRLDLTVRRLAALDDAELAARVIVDIGSRDLAAEFASAQVITVTVGAFALLPRALRLAGVLREEAKLDYTFLDGSSCATQEPRSFFRGQASLCAPSNGPTSDCPWIFAAALIRPGDASLLVRCLLAGNGDDDKQRAWSIVTRQAEAAIREFVLQWRCKRSLWPRPVEETLPEFV